MYFVNCFSMVLQKTPQEGLRMKKAGHDFTTAQKLKIRPKNTKSSFH